MIKCLTTSVCLHRFDRHLVDALAELEAAGVWHSSGTARQSRFDQTLRVMFQITGAMAEFERALIQEGVKARLAIARSKRKTLGRPKANRKRDKDATANSVPWLVQS